MEMFTTFSNPNLNLTSDSSKNQQIINPANFISFFTQQNLLFFLSIFTLQKKMNFKISNLVASNIKPLAKQHSLSLHQLSKWNQHLDCQRLKTLYLQQDLKKQQKLAKQNQILLKKQVHSIEHQAVVLASELEQEKAKHQHLLVLVRNAEHLIYQDKLDKHQDVLNKKQPDQFEECKKVIIENEKKLQKILQKLNSSEFQISKKIDLIRGLRSERGIHSNVFDKLQNEYFDVEFFYKQLLIERILLENQLQKSTAQFSHIFQKSNLDISKINHQNRQTQATQITQNIQSPQQNQTKILNTFRIPELTFSNKDNNLTQRFKSKHDIFNGSKIMDKKNLDESKKLYFKKKLKQVLNDLACQGFTHVLKQIILPKVQEEDHFFDYSNQISDQIFYTQNQIKTLQNQLHKRKNIQSNQLSTKKINLHSQISEFQAQAELTKTQITNFKSQFQNILNNIVSNSNNLQNLSHTHMKSLNKAENAQKLTFSENHQLLKQIMAFFNDEIFDTYLHGNRTSNNFKIRAFGQKSSLRKKNHKLSNIGFEKKVRILRTQTDNTNQSMYSVRNSECLDTILGLQSSANEKFEKGEKTDNLSIMTEDELIEESKRLIRQIKKKKSQFIGNSSISKK